MANKELEQWYLFCEKCDKYIEEQKPGCYRHFYKKDIYWPILEYYLICYDVDSDYHYLYVFNMDDYEYVKQFVDDDGCVKEMFLRARNNGEGEYMI